MIISYLTSLEKFFKFAEDVQHDQNPLYSLDKQIIESIKRVNSNISAGWSLVHKQYKTDEWHRQLWEMKERVRPDDIIDLGRFPFVRTDWPAYSHRNGNFTFNQQ